MAGEDAVALLLARQPDSVRWLPSPSPVDTVRPLVSATWDWDTCTARLEGMVLATVTNSTYSQQSRSLPQGGSPELQTVVEWALPSRCSGQVCVAPLLEDGQQALVIAGTEGGDVVAGLADAWALPSMARDKGPGRSQGGAAAPRAPSGKVAATREGAHRGSVAAVDYNAATGDCVSAGDDGRLLCWRLEGAGKGAGEELGMPDGSDMAGGLAYSCAKWLSPTQLVSATLGGGVKWWDRRQSKAQPAATCQLSWSTPAPGAIASFHVHPSRQHLCVAGGSCGTLIAWDLRKVVEPTLLCGSHCHPEGLSPGQAGEPGKAGAGLAAPEVFLSSSDVMDVRFDPLLHLRDLQSARQEASGLPPLLASTSDGALSSFSDGEVSDLFVGTSSVSSFDVEPDFGQHVIFALGEESLGYIYRAHLF